MDIAEKYDDLIGELEGEDVSAKKIENLRKRMAADIEIR